MIILRLPYPVSANRLWRCVNGRMVLSAEGRAYKEKAHQLALEHFPKPFTGPTSIRLILRPKMNRDGSEDLGGMDLGNCEKIVSDALNRAAWVDDKQHRHISKDYGAPVKGGSIVVMIQECQFKPGTRQIECTEVAGLEW